MADPRYGVRADTTEPSDFYVPVTPGSSALEYGMCRAILCSEDGVLNLTDRSGNERENVPVQKGYNPIAASVIDAPTSGDAPSIVVALY